MSRYFTQDPKSATVKFSSGGASQAIPCLYEEMQGRRLILELSTTVPASMPVTVEYNDALFLGEVITCAEMDGWYKAEVKVEQILTGLQSLIILRARLLGEYASPSPQMVPAEAVR